MKKLLTLLLVIQGLTVVAQVPEPVNASKVFESYLKLYEEEKFEEALKELERIDRNDTSYSDALLERSNMNIKLEKYDKVIDLCKKGLELEIAEHETFFLNYSVALLRSERVEEAHDILDQALAKYPKNHLLVFNKAAAFNQQKKYDKALEYYKKCVQLNPYYANGHLTLGVIAADEGNIAQAMLSFNMFLILEPNSEISEALLHQLNQMVSSKYKKEPKGVSLAPEGGDKFDDVDLILTNYVALDKSYKVPVKTKLSLVKQNHALFSKLKYRSDDNGFWMQSYVRFFEGIMKDGLFEAFTYYILQASEYDNHKKLVRKNTDEINRFVSWAIPHLEEMNSDRITDFNGKKQKVKVYYNSEEHTVEAIGTPEKDSDNLVGYAELYFTSGALMATGEFKDGKRAGDWRYYYGNGNLSEELSIKAGEFDGPFKVYYNNGKLRKEGEYKEGEQIGEQKIYNRSGKLIEVDNYKNGKLNGDLQLYYSIGEPYMEYKGRYKDGKLQDTLFEYYDNNKIASVKIFDNGLLTGTRTTYYRTGQVATSLEFKDDKPHGEYKSYYVNGQLKEEGKYTEGIQVGLWKQYYHDGKLQEEVVNDEKGKKNGILKSYDTDGKIHYEMEFLRGEVIAYKYFDKKGNIINEDKRKRGEFDYVGFYPTGVKNFEGVYTKEGKSGLWKYYDEFGNLSAEEVYNDKGELHGTYKSYFVNGKLKQKTEFKNGELDGYSVYYHSNGLVKSEGWNRNDKAQGYWYDYYPNGKIKSKEYFLNGKITGYQEYFHITGKPEREEFYKYDLLEKITFFDTTGNVFETIVLNNGTGDYVTHYENKSERFKGSYLNGVAMGEFSWRHYNGKTSLVGKYFNDNRNGYWKWFYDSGKPSYEVEYYFGEKHGKVKDFYESGKIKDITSFQYGEKHGETILYYENGQLELKKIYVNGKEHGDAYFYDETGQLQMVRYYKDGIPTGASYYNADGELVPRIEFNKPEYEFVSYYQNGNKSREYSVDKGVFHGKYTEFHSNGQVAEISFYEHDIVTGENIAYYSTGKVRFEQYYKDGYLNGLCKYYYPNGKLKKELNYVMGELHGVCKYYSSDGSQIKEKYYYSDVVIKEINK